MKKNIIRLLFIAIVATVMVSCNGISFEGSNGKTYTDYKEACKDYEFDVAHKIADAQFEADGSENKYGEACVYIFDAESLFLIEQGDEESADRIFLLLEEFKRKRFNSYLTSDIFQINKVLSTALTVENTYLVKKIALNTKYNSLLILGLGDFIQLDVVIQYLLEKDEKDAAYKVLDKMNISAPNVEIALYNSGCGTLLDYALENGNQADAEKALEKIVIPPDNSDTKEATQFYNDAKNKFDRYLKAGKLK